LNFEREIVKAKEVQVKTKKNKIHTLQSNKKRAELSLYKLRQVAVKSKWKE
jgi:hypothetical protein